MEVAIVHLLRDTQVLPDHCICGDSSRLRLAVHGDFTDPSKPPNNIPMRRFADSACLRGDERLDPWISRELRALHIGALGGVAGADGCLLYRFAISTST